VVEADEELTVAGIRILRPRHRHRAAHVGLAVELRLELLARAAGAGALRTAGLRHKAVDHAVEDDPIIESIAHQLLDPGHMAGRISITTLPLVVSRIIVFSGSLMDAPLPGSGYRRNGWRLGGRRRRPPFRW